MLPLDIDEGFRKGAAPENLPFVAGGLRQGDRCFLTHLHPFLCATTLQNASLTDSVGSSYSLSPGLLQQSPKSLPVSTVYSQQQELL